MVRDKLFLLSALEVEEYLSSKESRICLFKGEKYWWWLRSFGYYTNSAACVSCDGSLFRNGNHVDKNIIAVRPALHLKIEYLNSLKRTDDGYVNFGNREWLVLDKETGLLLSKDAVCNHCFDIEHNDYEHSEIRDYLNDELYHDMFSVEEQREIIGTVVNKETTFFFRKLSLSRRSELMETDDTTFNEELLYQYKQIGTVEECRLAKEEYDSHSTN